MFVLSSNSHVVLTKGNNGKQHCTFKLFGGCFGPFAGRDHSCANCQCNQPYIIISPVDVVMHHRCYRYPERGCMKQVCTATAQFTVPHLASLPKNTLSCAPLQKGLTCCVHNPNLSPTSFNAHPVHRTSSHPWAWGTVPSFSKWRLSDQLRWHGVWCPPRASQGRKL